MKLQASFSSYGSKPTTLLGLLDDSGVLAIVQDVMYSETRVSPDVCLICDAALQEYDSRFTDDHLQGAIRLFFGDSGQGRIVLHDSVKRHDPSNKIEVQGIDEKGRKYAIQGLTNGHAAVLGLAYLASKQRNVAALDDAFAEFSSMYNEIFTI